MHRAVYYAVAVLGVYVSLTSWAHSTELRFNTQDFAPFSYARDGVVAGPAADLIRAVCSAIPARA